MLGGRWRGRALWVILVHFPFVDHHPYSSQNLQTLSSYCWAPADSWPAQHFLSFHCGFVVFQATSEINNVFWPSATSHYHKGEVTHMNSRKPCRVTVWVEPVEGALIEPGPFSKCLRVGLQPWSGSSCDQKKFPINWEQMVFVIRLSKETEQAELRAPIKLQCLAFLPSWHIVS